MIKWDLNILPIGGGIHHELSQVLQAVATGGGGGICDGCTLGLSHMLRILAKVQVSVSSVNAAASVDQC